MLILQGFLWSENSRILRGIREEGGCLPQAHADTMRACREGRRRRIDGDEAATDHLRRLLLPSGKPLRPSRERDLPDVPCGGCKDARASSAASARAAVRATRGRQASRGVRSPRAGKASELAAEGGCPLVACRDRGPGRVRRPHPAPEPGAGVDQLRLLFDGDLEARPHRALPGDRLRERLPLRSLARRATQ